MSNEKNTEGLNLTKKYASVLVKPTETVIATYGNDYFQNFFLSQNYEQFSFILTDKRLYYKGTRFHQVQGNWNTAGIGTSLVEENLDLKDITKSGFEHFNRFTIIYFIAGIISIFGGKAALKDAFGFMAVMAWFLIVLGILMIIGGICDNKVRSFTAIKFDYAGGSLCGNVKLYGEESARDFLRQVKRAQDEYK